VSSSNTSGSRGLAADSDSGGDHQQRPNICMLVENVYFPISTFRKKPISQVLPTIGLAFDLDMESLGGSKRSLKRWNEADELIEYCYGKSARRYTSYTCQFTPLLPYQINYIFIKLIAINISRIKILFCHSSVYF
jgi:hypothetical protein